MHIILAPALIFTAHALIYISLFSRLPEIAYALEVSKGTIGGVMLCSAVGVLLVTPFAGRIVARLTPPLAAALGLSTLAGLTPLMTLTPVWGVALLFFTYGAVSCALGVAENLIALRIEKDTGTKVLARSHGFWSVGMIIGTLWAAFLQANAVSPTLHITITFVVVLVVSFGVWKTAPRQWDPEEIAPKASQGKMRLSPAILLICLTVWGLALLEGANYDWALFYLQEINGFPAATASLVYTFMAIGMLAVRMVGDKLRSRYSDMVILRASAICGIAAILLFVSVEHVALSALAMIMMGFAVALIFPTGVALASTRSGMDPSSAIAAFSATLTLGHLAVPPAMGFIADIWGLPFVFLVLIVPITLTYILAPKAAGPIKP